MFQSQRASPIIRAQELLRISLATRSLQDLISHRHDIGKVLLELANYRASASDLSIQALVQIQHIEKKLSAHLHTLLVLIGTKQTEEEAAAFHEQPPQSAALNAFRRCR